MYKAECLSGLVGISNSEVVTSDVGLYIDRLPGISVSKATDQAGSAFGNDGETFIAGMINEAQIEFANRFSELMYGVYSTQKGTQANNYGRVTEASFYEATDGAAVGIKLYRSFADPLQNIQINSVILNSEVDAVLTISDGIQQIEVPVTHRVLTPINFTTNRNQITIMYAPQIGETYAKSPMHPNRYCLCPPLTYYGLAAVANTGSRTDEAFGLTINAGLLCDESQLLCAIRPRCAYMLRDLAAALIFNSADYSERNNPTVYLSKKESAELATVYYDKFTNAANDLRRSISGIVASLQTTCIKCSAQTVKDIRF
jgi:hypothetical protein